MNPAITTRIVTFQFPGVCPTLVNQNLCREVLGIFRPWELQEERWRAILNPCLITIIFVVEHDPQGDPFGGGWASESCGHRFLSLLLNVCDTKKFTSLLVMIVTGPMSLGCCEHTWVLCRQSNWCMELFHKCLGSLWVRKDIQHFRAGCHLTLLPRSFLWSFVSVALAVFFPLTFLYTYIVCNG